MTDLSQQRLLALSYNAYERLVDSRMRLDTLLKPVRRAFAEETRIPSWAGSDLLRAWAFALVKTDEKAGTGTLELSREWIAVMAALGQDHLPETPLPTMFSAAPKIRGDEAFLAAKQARLFVPHVAPINRLTERIAKETRSSVPYVDPDSGGIRARFLIVLETPTGPAALGSGVLSADNDDETAKNVWHPYDASGMARADGLHWNAAPWYTGSKKKNKSVKNAEVEAGRKYLFELLDLTLDIRVVLALRRKAPVDFYNKRAPFGPECSISPFGVPRPTQRGQGSERRLPTAPLHQSRSSPPQVASPVAQALGTSNG